MHGAQTTRRPQKEKLFGNSCGRLNAPDRYDVAAKRGYPPSAPGAVAHGGQQRPLLFELSTTKLIPKVGMVARMLRFRTKTSGRSR